MAKKTTKNGEAFMKKQGYTVTPIKVEESVFGPVETDIPIFSTMNSRSAKVAHPDIYKVINDLEDTNSRSFPTAIQKTVVAVKQAIEKESKKRFEIRKENATNSRIWRNDKKKSRKGWGGPRTTADKPKRAYNKKKKT